MWPQEQQSQIALIVAKAFTQVMHDPSCMYFERQAGQHKANEMHV
jgi:hypothetical protein